MLSPLPALAVMAIMIWPSAASATPRAPTDDHEVIERLPSRLPGAGPRRVSVAVPSAVADLHRSLTLARQSIEQARRSGDPRDWGRAQAALARWWADPQAPAPVRLLRATIRQGQHDFAGALADLDRLLAEPAIGLRAQAELTRASIHQVQGRYAEAREGCEHLAGAGYAALGMAVQVPARACLAELGQLQGRLNERRADAALAALGGSDDAWLALLRAELAARSGRARAGALFAAATAGDAPSLYALAARADWLLERHRPAEAERLLRGYEGADALLLRRAIALRQLAAGSPKANAELEPLQARLQASFDAALARGDRSHAREQALFALELQGDPDASLALAETNWAWQREPADALLLLRAAEAAGRPEAGEPVRRWAREQGFSDARWPPRITPKRASRRSGDPS
ncbi:hypothetical protein [Ideonella sp.]|uniref:hypothetical protein n=1 Tax=Ideonella sp. TaxID=1929293 RepID=UPI002B48CA92|nr:hypothetical protein [Ideonella sp.]HJV68874.1 hypothetical protein [Ideonella sp.]